MWDIQEKNNTFKWSREKKEKENCSQTIHQTRPSIVRGVKDGLFIGCLNLLCPPSLFYLTADFERMTLVAVILTGGGGVMNLMCKQWLTRVRNVLVFVVLSMFAHWQATLSPNLVARYDALAVYVPTFSLCCIVQMEP